jgi:glycine dehydrogenase subunit 1
MTNGEPIIYPYIPNSVPAVRREMLKAVGVDDVDTLYQEIPKTLRLKRTLRLPEPCLSEYELKRHIMRTLSKNKTCEDYLSFLGAGCWQHYVPAVCDEIIGRSEILTAYAGGPYSNFGKYQLWFEFQSEMGELVGMDVVSFTVYSWGVAAGLAIRMASRMTGRSEVLLPKTICPERLAAIRTYCQPAGTPGHIEIKLVEYNTGTGLLDTNDLKKIISSKTAAVYIENPSYLGFIETQGKEISKIAKEKGAEFIVGVDPISLGLLATPADYGADIVVGTAQSLGIHMNAGGSTIGFIASRDEERYVAEYPTFLINIVDTVQEGEHAFSHFMSRRVSYAVKDELGRTNQEVKDYFGTAAGLWSVSATVYMALMGPRGFADIGKTIVQKSQYAIKLLSGVRGITIPFSTNSFKEFVVNFDQTGKTVKDINKALLRHHIFGGKDITSEFPELGNSALYCVTEVHSEDDIKKLASALEEVLRR